MSYARMLKEWLQQRRFACLSDSESNELVKAITDAERWRTARLMRKLDLRDEEEIDTAISKGEA